MHVELIERDRYVHVAGGAEKLQRHATHEHELHLGTGQGPQQLAVATADLDHTDARCSSRHE